MLTTDNYLSFFADVFLLHIFIGRQVPLNLYDVILK